MFSQGVDLVRVEVITDDVDDIMATVQRMSDLVGPDGFVFTSGGIGSTHDDVTYEAIVRRRNAARFAAHRAQLTLFRRPSCLAGSWSCTSRRWT